MTGNTDDIRLYGRDGIGVMTLNRPEELNVPAEGAWPSRPS